MTTAYKSRVYTDRPAYADFDAPHKFEAIKSIIARRLTEYPNAICSYSGGSDAGGPMPWAAIVAGMVLMIGGGAMIC